MKFFYVVGESKNTDDIVGMYLSDSKEIVRERFSNKHNNLKFTKVSVLEKDEIDRYKLFVNKKKSM